MGGRGSWGRVPINWLALALLRAEAGSRPGGRPSFLARARKEGKRSTPLLSVSLRFAAGNLRCSFAGCAAQLTARLRRSVRTDAASQTTKRVCPSAHPPPRALRFSARPEGQNNTGHRCARPGAARRVAPAPFGAERSDGPCGVPPLLEAPVAGRLRGGMRACARMLRALTRRDCPSAAAQQRSEFHGAPRKRPDAGCPGAQRRGRSQQGRLSFGFFSLATQRKEARPLGRDPASALSKASASQIIGV